MARSVQPFGQRFIGVHRRFPSCLRAVALGRSGGRVPGERSPRVLRSLQFRQPLAPSDNELAIAAVQRSILRRRYALITASSRFDPHVRAASISHHCQLQQG
jgi:hypothetical protein